MNFKKLLLGLWLLAFLNACNFTPPASLLGITETPSLTPVPSSTPSPTPTTIPSPMPTMIPLVRVERGEDALNNGDFDLARAEFYNAINATTADDVQRAAALWGLIHVSYEDENYYEVLAFTQQLANEYPNSPFLAYAHFLSGQANDKINRYQAAADSYATYLSLRPGLLENYVEKLRGDLFSKMGNHVSALNAYRSALLAPSLHNGISLEVKIATSKAELGDFAGALADYESISNRTNNDFIKAQMDYFAGYAHLMLDEKELGYARYQHAVENYPLAYHSYIALVDLIAADIPVDALNRGLADYGAKQYDVALVALDRYIAENAESDGTAQYYRAKTLYALGRYEDEVAAWSEFIAQYPNHPHWADAWAEKSYTQWHDLKNLEAGKQTLLDFVHDNPGHAEADDFLMSAARLMNQEGEIEEAIALWLRLSEEYPGSSLTPEALFLTAITTYRSCDYAQALTLFQRNLILTIDAEGQARAYLWIGKSQQQLGETEAMQGAWQQAQSADPTGYYSERARELLEGGDPFVPPNIYTPETDSASELAEAESWLRITFDLPADTDLKHLGPLQNDLRLQRGREFWELGLYNEARLEFESLRLDISDSPQDSFRLTNYMLDLGLYRPAIFAARQVLELAGMDSHADSLHAPAYFDHIRYGTYYSGLVEPIAEANAFHPLFIYSVMRQESLYESFILSAAGARGLMQIIPATGTTIANLHGYPVEYTENDLYRPVVSVKFGTWYLESNRALLDDDLYATLSAYNGGPGNAIEWQALGKGDPDLMLESIRFAETREYIKTIYETYAIYKSIYGVMQ